MSPRWRRAAVTVLAGVTGFVPAVPAAAADTAKTVYFTFDDGPGTGTAELLDAAAAYQAKVSLFYVGHNGEQRPELVARAAADGHVIGNHTYSHKSLHTMSQGEVRRQLVTGQVALRPYVSNCWRPPGWATSPAIEETAKTLGLRQTMSWMDPTDSRGLFIPAAWTDTDKIVATVQKQVFDGAMVTLHAEAGHNRPQLEAFKRLLPLLSARGYRFRALPHCDKPTYRLLIAGDGRYRAELDSLLRRGAEPRGLNHRWVGTTVADRDRSIALLQARYQPDLILVTLGTADIERGAKAATVVRRISALLRNIRRNQPGVTVLVAVPPARADGRSVAAQRQATALRRAMPQVIRTAGQGFHAVGPSTTGATTAARYYRAMRATMPGGRTWAAAPGPIRREP